VIGSINNSRRRDRSGMDHSDSSAEREPSRTEPDPPRVVTSADLFAGARVVVIEHAGQRYRLLITRNDRLILQK